MYQSDRFGPKTGFALLGLLAIRPMSGYDIKKFVAQTLSHFWSESYGNIYPTLQRLTERELVTKRTVRAGGSPERHVYSLTAKGRAALLAWLPAAVDEEPTVRSELLLKLFFGAQLGPDGLAAHIARFTEQQRMRHQQLRSAAALIRKAGRTNPNAFYWHLTVRRGLIMTEARLRWAGEVAHALKRHRAAPPTRRPKAASRQR